jgi:hypothetical protein
MRREGAELFETCTTFESSHLRSNAYAALGAVEIVASTGRHQIALDLIDRSTALIAAAARSSIPWPEPRLTYDNARIPEALIAAGWVLEDQRRLSMGLRLLNWLVEAETHGGHFSFTGVGGREPGGQRPAFDQQPIEAWAMTDACYRAWSATGDAKWRERALCAASWLLGKNDTDAVLYDRSTGATCDGLTAHSRNENCGAESTLSGLGALQTAARCLWAAGGAGAI